MAHVLSLDEIGSSGTGTPLERPQRCWRAGDLEHEFVLGDEQAQQQMAEEMDEGDGHAHSGEMSNAVTIHSGEEVELTWRFPDEATTVLVGCHVPGHYEAGMRGSVTVG